MDKPLLLLLEILYCFAFLVEGGMGREDMCSVELKG